MLHDDFIFSWNWSGIIKWLLLARYIPTPPKQLLMKIIYARHQNNNIKLKKYVVYVKQ